MSPRKSNGQFLPGTHWRPHRLFREKEYLEAEYLVKGRSATDIATEHGVTDESVRHWMRKHGIQPRTVSEARALKHWGVSGEDNPMFGKTGAMNPRYVDGSSPERQRMYAGHAWKAVVKAVYARDGYRCQRCNVGHDPGVKLHAHHLKPWAGNPDLRSELSNISTLCCDCHRWVHSRENKGKEWLQ